VGRNIRLLVVNDGLDLSLSLTFLGQVLGRFPAARYRLTTEEVVGARASLCRARPVAALTLLRQAAFAYLSCNGEAHVRNFSVARTSDHAWRVCPAYDLPSSWPCGDRTMAPSVNGRDREKIRRVDFLALGASVGLRERAVERALDELCDSVELWSVELWLDELGELPFDWGSLTKVRRAIEYRRDRLQGRETPRAAQPPGPARTPMCYRVP